jgi:hypothetical protein
LIVGETDTGPIVQSGTTIYSPDGSTYSSVDMALDVCYDPNFSPLLSLFSGMDNAATVKIKFVMGIEAVPNTTGPLSYCAVDPPQLERTALDLWEGLPSKLPPGAPASANGFWDTLKQVGQGLFDVIKFAAPYVIPFFL